ncbi:unnamed protein product [Amoebophrya sp. A120]|nr:unnamed protein product [Amoebophrya sp. A120]|eukprot:GSA120T00021346001.1
MGAQCCCEGRGNKSFRSDSFFSAAPTAGAESAHQGFNAQQTIVPANEARTQKNQDRKQAVLAEQQVVAPRGLKHQATLPVTGKKGSKGTSSFRVDKATTSAQTPSPNASMWPQQYESGRATAPVSTMSSQNFITQKGGKISSMMTAGVDVPNRRDFGETQFMVADMAMHEPELAKQWGVAGEQTIRFMHPSMYTTMGATKRNFPGEDNARLPAGESRGQVELDNFAGGQKQ